MADLFYRNGVDVVVVSHLVHQLNARAAKKSVVEMKLRNHFFRVHTHCALVKMRVVPTNQEDIYIHVFQAGA